MKLFLLYRAENDQGSWDTYDSCVVVAKNEAAARLIHPGGDRHQFKNGEWYFGNGEYPDRSWTHPDKLLVREVGTAKRGETGVLCASFNAG